MKKIFFLILISSVSFVYSQQLQKNKAIEEIKEEIDVIKNELAINPNLTEKYEKLGFLYVKLNDPKNAKTSFEKVLTLDPKNDRAYFMLGLTYEKEKMIPQAINAWEKCLIYTNNPNYKSIAQKHLSYLKK